MQKKKVAKFKIGQKERIYFPTFYGLDTHLNHKNGGKRKKKLGKGKCAQDINEQEMLRIVGLLKLGGLSHAV